MRNYFKNNAQTIQTIILIIGFLFYFIGYSIYISGSDYDPNSVHNPEIAYGVLGFILGLLLSAYLHTYVFYEDDHNNKNITIIFFIGIICISLIAISSITNLYNIKNVQNVKWTQFNQILFPLYGGLILTAEESTRHIILYLFSQQEYTSEIFKSNNKKFLKSSNSSISSSDDDEPLNLNGGE